MCTLTLSDFDALDTLDADTVLVAGEILKSEQQREAYRIAIAPYTKKGAGLSVLSKAITSITNSIKRVENVKPEANGRPGGRVIVH